MILFLSKVQNYIIISLAYNSAVKKIPTLLTDASSDARGDIEREADQTIFHHRRMNKIKRRRKFTRSQTRLLNIVP